MNRKIEDYVARISNASALQLVIINYELLIGFIQDAIDQAADRPEEPRERYEYTIKKAQDALSRLIEALNMEYALSAQLFDLYSYVSKLLNAAFFNRSLTDRTKNLAEAVEILEALLSSWRALDKEQADAPPLMENAQHIYAGLTYRNGALDEYIEDDGTRGFKI